MTINARADEQVAIEQLGGSKKMAGWMWTQAFDENERLKQQLAAAEARCAPLPAGYIGLRNELVQLKRERDEAREQLAASEQNCRFLETRQRTHRHIVSLQQRREHEVAELFHKLESIRTRECPMPSLRDENEQLKQQLAALQSLLREVADERDTFERRISLMHELFNRVREAGGGG